MGGRGTGMLHLRGQLPDDMGAKFEDTINQLTEQMKPVKGQPWTPLARPNRTS